MAPDKTMDNDSYDVAVFKILAYEFDFDSSSDTEKKIRTKLRRQRLGPYDQERVEYLRSLKNDLQKEIGLFHNSMYYVGIPGAIADHANFDFSRMVSDYLTRYPRIDESDMRTMISFAIYVYYLL